MRKDNVSLFFAITLFILGIALAVLSLLGAFNAINLSTGWIVWDGMLALWDFYLAEEDLTRYIRS